VTPPDSPQDDLTPLPDLVGLWLQADPEHIARKAGEQHDRKIRMISVVGMMAVAVLGTMYVNRPWVYAAAGVDMALALWIMNGKDLRLSRLTIGGIPVIGFYWAIFPPETLSPAQRLGYFVAASSLLIVADGALARVHYLWRNPVVSVPAE
jgi:hypothetical protein